MICPHCGAENSNDAVFCTNCNGWVFGCGEEEITSPPAEVAAPAEDRTEEPPAKKRRRWPIFCAAGAAAAALLLCVIFLWPKQENNYIECLHQIDIVMVEGKIRFLYDDRLIETDISPETVMQSCSSLDGGAISILTGTNHLLLIRDGAVTVVSDNVTDHTMSISGSTIAYCRSENSTYMLFVYDVDTGSASMIDSTPFQPFAPIQLSPDGQKVAYLKKDGANMPSKLTCFDGAKIISLHTMYDGTDLLGLSNDGLIYTSEEKQIVLYQPNGSRKILSSYTHLNDEPFHFNADHSQILFYTADGTFISEDGGTPQQIISDKKIEPLIPKGTQVVYGTHIYTYPMADLYGIPYISNKYRGLLDNFLSSSIIRYSFDLSYIDAQPKNSRSLATDVTRYWLYAGSDDLYCLLDDNSLIRIQISEKDAMPVVLAENVTTFVVSADGGLVYYISENDLYSCDSKTGKDHTLIHENGCLSLCISREDVVYYQVALRVYRCTNGSVTERVLDTCDYMTCSNSGMVYAHYNGHIYVSTADGELKPIT